MSMARRVTTRILRPSVVLLVVLAAAVGTTLVVSPTAETTDDADSSGAADDLVEPDAGVWYCSAERTEVPTEEPTVLFAGPSTEAETSTPTPTSGETSTPLPRGVTEGDASGASGPVRTSIVAARMPSGNQPASWTSRTIGAAGVDQLGEVFPGSTQTLATSARASLEVRWSQAPLTVHQLSRVDEDNGGALVRPCSPDVARSWLVPGISTATGVEGVLRITNPLGQDAAVAIEGLTPQGLENPLALQNLSVPAGATLLVDVNHFLPQLPDLALHVIARSGRVSVDGTLRSEPTVSGVAGRTAMTPVAEPATRWFVPWAVTTGRVDGRGDRPGESATAGPTATPSPEPTATGTATPGSTESPDADDILDVTVEGEAVPSSWLWLANPDPEQAATVTLSWLTRDGRQPADVLGTVEIEPSSLRRINVDELAPDVPGDVGVDVEVTNDVPIAVGRGVVVDDGDDAGRTGIGVVSGVQLADDQVTVTTLSGSDREQWLTVVNPYGEAAVVDLTAWNGTTSQSPSRLQDVEVPAGSTVSLEMTQWATGNDVFTVFVSAESGAVAASLRGLATTDRMDFAMSNGVPEGLWTNSSPSVAIASEEGMVNRFGTGLGMPVEAPTPTPTVTPAPTVTPTTPGPRPTATVPSPTRATTSPAGPTSTDGSTPAGTPTSPTGTEPEPTSGG